MTTTDTRSTKKQTPAAGSSPPAPRRRAGPRRLLLLLVAVVVAAGIVYAAVNRPVAVATAHPALRPVVDSLAVSGRVHGRLEADVPPPRAGVVEAVFVREGDHVDARQPLARVLSEAERRQLEQARAAVEVAAARLEQARRGPLPSEVERARAEGEQAVETARERLEQAREQLRLLEAGSRAQEREQAAALLREAQAREQAALLDLRRQEQLHAAEGADRAELDRARAAETAARAQVTQAEASAAQAQRDLERAERLFEEGAIARAEVDRARTQAETTAAQLEQARSELARARQEVERQERLYEINRGVDLERARANLAAAREAAANAQARLRDLEAGPRPEELARASASVREAEAAVRGAERSLAAQLATLLAQPRPEDVAVAEASVQEARRAVAVSEERVREATLRAPFAGLVVGPVAEAGEAVGAAQPLLRLVDIRRLEIRLETDENNLGRLAVGQEALVSAEAFPGRVLRARVTEIGSRVDPLRGTVEVRLEPHPAAEGDAEPPPLRPGQTVNVNLLLSETTERLTLPPGAALREPEGAFVYVVEDGRAVRRAVTLGPPAAEGSVILDGLTAADRVILEPERVRPGRAVTGR